MTREKETGLVDSLFIDGAGRDRLDPVLQHFLHGSFNGMHHGLSACPVGMAESNPARIKSTRRENEEFSRGVS
jgi:hypothetical protein